jgi:hypothetical protein
LFERNWAPSYDIATRRKNEGERKELKKTQHRLCATSQQQNVTATNKTQTSATSYQYEYATPQQQNVTATNKTQTSATAYQYEYATSQQQNVTATNTTQTSATAYEYARTAASRTKTFFLST